MSRKKAIAADTKSWTYEEICDMEFRTILPGDCYTLDESTGLYTDMRETDAGLPFHSNTGSMSVEEKEAEFRSYISSLDQQEQADAYIRIMSIPGRETLDASVAQIMGSMTREDMETKLTQSMVQQTGMGEDEITSYVGAMSDEEMQELFTEMAAEQVKQQYAETVSEQMNAMTEKQMADALTLAMDTYTAEACAAYYDEILTFSESGYEDNLVQLGCLDMDEPATVNLYASTFEGKNAIEDAISLYNESAEEIKQIEYTDYVGIMMSSVTSIINAVTYVLIAFVAISLIVSSIMIGVITLISVQERTKEIGILRAIGASKQNVSSMFNAETVIIGFASGAIGVILTWLLCIPVNAVIQNLTGIANLKAYPPWQAALILIGISVLLSVIAGFIPSRSAAKKDPVVALRSE